MDAKFNLFLTYVGNAILGAAFLAVLAMFFL
jgi:hypothetical protein